MRQLHFFKNPSFEPYKRLCHGGDIRKGKRKLARPFDRKRAMHLVLRSEEAKGGRSLLCHSQMIENTLRFWANRYGVRIYRFANAGNHIHLLVKARSKSELQNFLRVVAGKIAQTILKAVKGKAQGKFWSALAFSRVVTWGREFIKVMSYVEMNELEAQGLSTRRKLGWRTDPSQRAM